MLSSKRPRLYSPQVPSGWYDLVRPVTKGRHFGQDVLQVAEYRVQTSGKVGSWKGFRREVGNGSDQQLTGDELLHGGKESVRFYTGICTSCVLRSYVFTFYFRLLSARRFFWSRRLGTGRFWDDHSDQHCSAWVHLPCLHRLSFYF